MGETVEIRLPADVLDEIESEADDLGMSRPDYLRKHLHAGRRLFQSSGKLDTKMLQQLVAGDEASALQQNELTIDAEGIEDDMLAILPTEKTRAVTKENLRKDIFGTIDDQADRLDNALDYLEEREQIGYTADSGENLVVYQK